VSAILDMPSGNAALLEWYDGQKLQVMTYATQPNLALLPKDEDTGGKYYPVPVQFEVNQGRSATFSNAQGNQTAPQLAEFLVTRKKDYDVATIDNETLEASMSERGAFMKLGTLLVDSAVRGCTISVGSSLFRAGTGSIGQISGSVSSGVITLVNPADVCQFGVNQTLQANGSDGGSPRAALGYVIARSIRNGTVTVSSTAIGGSAGSPSGWGANDYLLVQGDNNAKVSGYSAWLPLTDPTSSDNFYGVNRSPDYRLFGVNYDGSGQPIEEALIDHSLLLAREGSLADHCMTNFGSMAALVKALGTRRQYVDIVGPANIGFRALVVDGAQGPIKVLADRNCQVQTAFMLQLDTWKVISLGPVPKVLKYEDRMELLRVYNADSAECRVGAYFNLVCNAPGWNGQLKLAS
jgi:hypothetical protein